MRSTFVRRSKLFSLDRAKNLLTTITTSFFFRPESAHFVIVQIVQKLPLVSFFMPGIVSLLLGDFGAIVIALKEEEGRGKNEENLLWECQFGFTSMTFFCLTAQSFSIFSSERNRKPWTLFALINKSMKRWIVFQFGRSGTAIDRKGRKRSN